MSRECVYDVVIVGAGAAGLMTAVQCYRLGHSVLLLEGQKRVGAKILMSGGGRCNITNDNIMERDYAGEAPKMTQKILKSFRTQQTKDFFMSLGVEMICDERGQYYPSTHRAQTVLDAFLQYIDNSTINLQTESKVCALEKKDNIFSITTDQDQQYIGKAVVLCAGGLSYPSTGSDGRGYRFAKKFQHKLVDTSAALTPFTSNDGDWKSLMGLSVDAVVSLYVDQKKYKTEHHPILFTHFGFSGLGLLNVSRYYSRLKVKHSVKLEVNFRPQETQELFVKYFSMYTQKNSHVSVRKFFVKDYPERFVNIFLKKINVDGNISLNQVKKDIRKKIIQALYHFPLDVTGVFGYKKAEATAGGIPLRDIHMATMESKKESGLFFAGEICDVDGRIGGFNFQWAWSSGYVASRGVEMYLAK